MIKKPLLAGNVDLSKLKYPVICSPKLDGIRCLIINGRALSRTFKPIPNKYTREKLEEQFKGSKCVHDGELIIDGCNFNEISSAIMSEDGEPDFKYIRFDCVTDPNVPYIVRVSQLRGEGLISIDVANNEEELLALDSKYLDLGYEGTMLRDPEGIYKQGRSTTKEGILLKLKKFTDSEAEIIGFVEQMKNQNEISQDDTGKNKRSKKKENLVPKNTLGTLNVRDVKSGVEFEVSTGLTDEQRKTIWDNQSEHLGRIVKYKFQSHGTLNKPRCPVFVGFRHKDDM